MAVVITKAIRKKRTQQILLAALILSTAAVVYFSFLRKTQPQITVLPAEVSPSQPASPPAAELKIKILEDERFKNLKPSPGLPLATTTPGKSNPFSD